MIFKSPGDTQGHCDSSEISEFLAGKFPMLFCLFHAVFIIIVQKPNTFLKICCTLCEKIIFAFERSYITFAMTKSMLDVPIPGSF